MHGEPLPNLGQAIKDLPGLPVTVKVVKREGKGDKAGTFYSNIGRYVEKKPQNTGWKGGF